MTLAWDSLSSFVAMGGHGLYVWGAFGMTAAVVAAECWALMRAPRPGDTP